MSIEVRFQLVLLGIRVLVLPGRRLVDIDVSFGLYRVARIALVSKLVHVDVLFLDWGVIRVVILRQH